MGVSGEPMGIDSPTILHIHEATTTKHIPAVRLEVVHGDVDRVAGTQSLHRVEEQVVLERIGVIETKRSPQR